MILDLVRNMVTEQIMAFSASPPPPHPSLAADCWDLGYWEPHVATLLQQQGRTQLRQEQRQQQQRLPQPQLQQLNQLPQQLSQPPPQQKQQLQRKKQQLQRKRQQQQLNP